MREGYWCGEGEEGYKGGVLVRGIRGCGGEGYCSGDEGYWYGDEGGYWWWW